jgi:hypothetical protein
MHLQTLVARRHLSIARTILTDPNVYRATDRGLRAKVNGAQATRRDPIGNHLVHELLITELAVSISEIARSRSEVKIPWQCRFELAGDPAFRGLVPDYAFLFNHNSGSMICFAEIFSGEESIFRIGQKFQQYAAWATLTNSKETLLDIYRSNGAHSPRPRFRLLVVAHNRRSDGDESRLAQILVQALENMPPQFHHRVWGTTPNALELAFQQEPWIKASDLTLPIPTPGEIPAPGERVLPKRRRHLLLLNALRQAPHYPLFPRSTESNDVASSTE